ncbi:MAG TPA: hypothetical protein VJN18_20800 [Polyangiaceae bacterium]|nr:hypothetical protein [Polyangiaceae bacterium]
MRTTLAPLGYEVLETSSSGQLAVVLRSKAALQAPRLFLIVAAALAVPCQAGLATVGRERAGSGLPVPHVVVTFEFGAAQHSARPTFAPCVSAGYFEKPFDLALIHSIATRCSTFPAVAEARLSRP